MCNDTACFCRPKVPGLEERVQDDGNSGKDDNEEGVTFSLCPSNSFTGLLCFCRGGPATPQGKLPERTLYIDQNFFCRVQKGLGTSLALQCYAGLASSGFPCKVA